jgi:tartrate-resistant acid phosphatase type 5
MKRLLVTVFLCFAAVVCLFIGCTSETPKAGSLIFYVLGDWGTRGSATQISVANQMELWTSIDNPRFIVATGDNFYPVGVASTKDSHWQASFENVYDGFNLKTKPWFVALGNHDYLGSPDAEIAYHDKNPRWNMPSRYYTRVERTGDGGSARLIFIDSSPFEKSYYSIPELKDKVSGQDTLRQKQWLDSVCSRKDADWMVVVGHHHIYTGGARKDEANSVRTSLETIFEKNDVDVYFSGHEHDLQHLKSANKPTHYFVSGAASGLRPTGMMEHSLFAASVEGFMSVTVRKQTLEVKVIDHEGNVLYSTTIVRLAH